MNMRGFTAKAQRSTKGAENSRLAFVLLCDLCAFAVNGVFG